MKKLLFIAVLIVICLILCGTIESTELEKRVYVVREGDTLWEIGERVAPFSDRRQWVYEVCRINGIDASLDMGQRIIVLWEKGK